MKPAIRGGVILLICLLAVFPCGAALTVLGTAAGETFRPSATGGNGLQRLVPMWISVAWATTGMLGFLFLISGVDKLIAAQRRLPWYGLLAISLEIAAAGLFSATYPLRGSSALLFRIISVAPVLIAFALLVHHIVRFVFASKTVNPSLAPTVREAATSDTQKPGRL